MTESGADRGFESKGRESVVITSPGRSANESTAGAFGESPPRQSSIRSVARMIARKRKCSNRMRFSGPLIGTSLP